MLRELLSIGVGIYVGVYIAQNYEINKVDDPVILWEKFKKFVDEKLNEGKKK